MKLTEDHFPDFIAEAHDTRWQNGSAGVVTTSLDAETQYRRRPYRWQERLLAQVCAGGRWPEQILAPTGAGKTAVIDVHLFAVALMARGGTRVPRRLALVVDRRALTDDQYGYTRDLITRLNKAEAGSVLGEVAAALRSLRWAGLAEDEPPDPVLLGRLRGGVPASRAWRDEPEACSVLCATPAMWGSRLLFRGYGTTRAARPREAGLLAMDAVAVLDEAHLAGQALTTARRVAELAGPEADRLAVPPLQIVETTATSATEPGEQRSSVGVVEDDLAPGVDDELRRRVCSKKALTVEALPTWPLPDKGAQRAKGIRRLAELAVAQHAEFGATVGCYVNTVETALDLAAELERRSDLDVGVFCGRMRPHGAAGRLARLHATGEDGEPRPFDVVVTTQTLEVGIDCSFTAGITELASGSALAQRAGRFGRTGDRAAVTVFGPAQALSGKARSGPYSADELTAAHRWLDGLADLAPWTVATTPPPPAAARRTLYQRLEPAEAEFLTRTSTEPAHDHDVAWWLAEDFDTAQDVGLLVRTGLPDEPDQLVELLEATPVADHEVFPARLNSRLRDALTALIPAEPGAGTACVGLVRGGEADVLNSARDLAPGDLIVVSTEAELFRSEAAMPGPGATTATDVLEDRIEVGALVLRLGEGSHVPRSIPQVQRLLDEVAELGETRNDSHGRTLLANLLTDVQPYLPEVPPTLPEIAALLRTGRVRDCEVTVHLDLDDEPCRVIVRDLRRATRDEATRQTFTTATDPVPLAQHNTAVGARAGHLAHALQLPAPMREVLGAAGRHHDDGKIDSRFQRLLGATDGDPVPIAKSPYRSPAQRRADRFASGLPSGWRHEQLSALHYDQRHTGGLDDEKVLVLRLIGTSHGYGRGLFDHTGTDLLTPGDPGHDLAEAWFRDGRWDQLIDTTHRRWGLWGCAYLEALLRAADSQISMEGS